MFPAFRLTPAGLVLKERICFVEKEQVAFVGSMRECCSDCSLESSARVVVCRHRNLCCCLKPADNLSNNLVLRP